MSKTYAWDIRNRLISVDNRGKIVTYKYDHNDLRVEKDADGVVTRYYYDGSLLVAEKDGDGSIMKVYVNDGGRGRGKFGTKGTRILFYEDHSFRAPKAT